MESVPCTNALETEAVLFSHDSSLTTPLSTEEYCKVQTMILSTNCNKKSNVSLRIGNENDQNKLNQSSPAERSPVSRDHKLCTTPLTSNVNNEMYTPKRSFCHSVSESKFESKNDNFESYNSEQSVNVSSSFLFCDGTNASFDCSLSINNASCNDSTIDHDPISELNKLKQEKLETLKSLKEFKLLIVQAFQVIKSEKAEHRAIKSKLETENNLLKTRIEKLSLEPCVNCCELKNENEKLNTQNKGYSEMLEEFAALFGHSFNDLEFGRIRSEMKLNSNSYCTLFQKMKENNLNIVNVNDLIEDYNELKDLYDEIERHYTEIQTENSQLKESIATLEKRLPQSFNLSKYIELDKYNMLEAEKNDLMLDLNKKLEEIKYAEEKYEKLYKNTSNLENELKVVNSCNMEYKDKCSKLESKIEELNNESASTKVELTALKEKYKQKCDSMEVLIGNNFRYEELADSYESLFSENQKIKFEMTKFKSLCQNLKGKMKGLMSLFNKLESLYNICGKLKNETSILNSQIQSLKSELKEKSKDCDLFAEKYKELQFQFDELKSKQLEAHKNYIDEKKCINFLKENHNAIIADIRNLKQNNIIFTEETQKLSNLIESHKQFLEEKSYVGNLNLDNLNFLNSIKNECASIRNKIHDMESILECPSLESIVNNFDALHKRCSVDYNKLNELDDICTLYGKLKNDLETVIREKCNMKENFDNLYSKYETLKTSTGLRNNALNVFQTCKNCSTHELEIKMFKEHVCSLLQISFHSWDDMLDIIKRKLSMLNDYSEMLEEEKLKSKHLDEECEYLNHGVQYLEKQVEKITEEYSLELSQVNVSLKKEEEKCLKLLSNIEEYKNNISELENSISKITTENSELNDTIHKLTEVIKPLQSDQIINGNHCCNVLKAQIQDLKLAIIDRNSKITALELHIQSHDSTHNKLNDQILDYRKKIFDLKCQLREEQMKENKNWNFTSILKQNDEVEENSKKPRIELCGQPSRIIQDYRVAELEEKVKKLQKSKALLQRLCVNRAKLIKELKGQNINYCRKEDSQLPRVALQDVNMIPSIKLKKLI